MAAPKQTDPQFKLRMPQSLKDALDKAVIESGRTLNAEMVWRLERSLDYAKLIADHELAEARLAEKEKTERDLRRHIEILEANIEDLKAGRYVDLGDEGVQAAMIARMEEVMGGVVEDMREQHRLTNGLHLLLKWFSENPEERAEYEALPEAEREEFAREKTFELWNAHLDRSRRPKPRSRE